MIITVLNYALGVGVLLLIFASLGLVAQLIGSIIDWARGKPEPFQDLRDLIAKLASH